MSHIKNAIRKIDRVISLKYTFIYLALMISLYLFSMFGSMFSTSDFTYADF